MPDQAGTRYGHRAGRDPTRPGEPHPNEDRLRDTRSQGKATRGKDEVATRRHLEGAEQGPM